MKTYSIPTHLEPEAIERLEQAMIEHECSKCGHKLCRLCISMAIINKLKGRVND